MENNDDPENPNQTEPQSPSPGTICSPQNISEMPKPPLGNGGFLRPFEPFALRASSCISQPFLAKAGSYSRGYPEGDTPC